MSNDTAPPALADSVNLDEGRALLENATPGPWKIGKAMTDEVAICDDTAGVIAVRRGLYANRGDANAELICWARNNLPALLSAVAALERERDEAVKAERERCAVLRVWLLDLSANESDPNEPVADNGATVWDHIRGDARRFAESLT